MSALILSNGEMNGNEIFIGTTSDLTAANGQRLYPGGQFNFPGGENTTHVYVLSPKDVTINITYRPFAAHKIDWRETDEAKQLASQMVTDVEKLIDEGRLIDLTDYKQSIKVYNDWVERCSVTLGRIDNHMRRFDRNTSYRSKWDSDNHNWKGLVSDEIQDKQLFKSHINVAIAMLNYTSSQIAGDTKADVDLNSFKNVLKNWPEPRVIKGVAILKNGQITVFNIAVTQTSEIYASGQDDNVSGSLRITNIKPGVSFDIVSSNGADNGKVAWFLYQ